MQLFFRDEHLNTLLNIAKDNESGSTFTLLFGRRKVGKTTIVKQYLKQCGGAYVSISSKSTYLQLQDIREYLSKVFFAGLDVPEFNTWYSLFKFLFEQSKEKRLNIVIDEFHNMELVNKESIEEFRKVWSEYAEGSKLNLTVISSSYDFIDRHFNSQNSPLYEINSFRIKVTPFKLPEIIALFRLHGSERPVSEIITIYIIFGGLPKYYFLFERYNLWNKNIREILQELIFMDFAPLAYELKELLVSDFSKGNKIYLSILQAIAVGHNKMSDIARAVHIPVTNLTKYLFELEKKKRLIRRELPINNVEAGKSKFGRYYIKNYFENFWFQFIQSDYINYEMGQFERMTDSIMKNLDEYVNSRMIGILHEILRLYKSSDYIKQIFSHPISRYGAIWNRREVVDLVLESQEHQIVLFGIFAISNTPLTLEQATLYYSYFMEFKPLYQGLTKTYSFVVKVSPDEQALEFCENNNIRLLYQKDFFNVVMDREEYSRKHMVEVAL